MDKIGMVDGDKLLDWIESKVWSCRDTQEKHGWNDAVWTLIRLFISRQFHHVGHLRRRVGREGPSI